ncbi:MAG: hypothetical protein WD894_14695 [Pirellulales bacterium]
MRKFIAMLLALALVTPFSLGCGDKKKTEKTEKKEVKENGDTKTEVKTEEKTETTDADK